MRDTNEFCSQIMRALARTILGRQSIEPIIIEKFGQVADRCVLFEIYPDQNSLFCEIVGGIPQGEHNIGLVDPLKNHPDIEEAVQLKKMMIIFDPLGHYLTQYFVGIIEAKDIRQIIYLPLVSKVIVAGVIVIDFCDDSPLFKEDHSDTFLKRLEDSVSQVLSDEHVRLERKKKQWTTKFIWPHSKF